MNDRVDVVIRPMGDQDRALIISNFLKSQRREGANTFATNTDYFAHWTPVAQALVQGPVAIAHLAEDPWLVLGWMAHEPGAIRFAYTRHSFRRAGVFDALYHHVNPTGVPMGARHVGRNFASLQRKYDLSYRPGVT